MLSLQNGARVAVIGAGPAGLCNMFTAVWVLQHISCETPGTMA